MNTYNGKPSLLGDEGGAGTAWWIFWMIIFLIFGGVAADSSNAWRMRAELQATADAAAHAGVIDLIDGGPAARAAAIDMAEKNMSTALHSTVLVPADVLVGVWNGASFTALDDSEVFEIDAEGEEVLVANAVLTRTRRDVNNSNRLKTYFLRLIGMDGWNVNAMAIAQRYFPDCLSGSAIISAQIVDMQSNNKMHPGICIHAQDYVSVNGGGGPDKDDFGNVWEPGVHVTMPSLPKFYDKYGAHGNQEEHLADHNEGLVPALGEEWFYPKVVDSIGKYLESYVDTEDPEGVWPSYIGKNLAGEPLISGTETLPDGTVVNIPVPVKDLIKTVEAAKWDITKVVPGYIYNVTCKKSSNTVNLNTSVDNPLQNVVVIANCGIKLATNNGLVVNSVIGTTAGFNGVKTDNSIIDIGMGTTLGDSVDCSNPGNVKLLSSASVSGPAGTQYKGVQVLAKGNVKLAAKADAKVEINVQAGGDIDFTSGNEFGEVCVIEDDDLLRATYYRLVL